MADEIIVETVSTEVVEVGVAGPQGPAGAAGTGLETLTTQGDTLYRGDTTGERLAIGTTGQVLKVSAQGLPTWANESGAVSSVAGKTGVVTLDKNDVGLGNVANTAQVTSVTGTAPIVSSGGTTPAISISAATASAAGSMSAADKTKLDGIAAGAEVNVNADWNATSGDAQILNKPSTFAPSSHSSSHASAGSDPLFDQDLNTTDTPTFAGLVLDGSAQLSVGALSVGTNNLFIDVGAAEIEAGLPISFTGASAATNAATTLTNLGGASDDHVHGNLTNDGKVGSDSGRVLVTTTAGAVTALALGTANQVLRVNSGATGVEFADPSGGGVTGAAASASDVLGVSGSNITGVDAGSADRLVFWDDSAGKLTHLTLGSNALTIDGTTLKSQPLFPVEPISRGATYIPYIGSGSNGNSSSAVNTSNGFVLFAPVYVRKSANYTTFSVIVSTAGSASSLGKMALYTIKAADALPDALVCESGTFATDSTGLKQPTMASTFVSEGWYYMAIGTNSTTNVTFYGDTMLLLRGVFSGAALNAISALLDYSQKLYADFWPNPWNGTGSTFRNAFHPITSLT